MLGRKKIFSKKFDNEKVSKPYRYARKMDKKGFLKMILKGFKTL